MEVSQAIWLTCYFVNALLISPKRFDEIILDFYQDAGIWIVIASCVAEYLLLLTYIGVAAYDFFKNRKMMKKMNVQRRTYEFLKFDESHRDVGNRWHDSVSVTKDKTAEKRDESKAKQPWSFANIKPKGIFIASQSANSKAIKERDTGELNSGLKANNPQQLKFDGENHPASENFLKKGPRRWLGGKPRDSRMNKSLKRKQIE